ncbi:MAG: glycoside hydrolase family 44 protein [Terriglobales bacterium]
MSRRFGLVLVALLSAALLRCGGGGSAPPSNSGPAGPAVPTQVTGLTADAAVAKVSLSWTAVSGATSYQVQRAASSTAPFAVIASPTGTSYADTSGQAGDTYYYQVLAVNAAGNGPPSAAVSATPWGSQSATITVNAYADRHPISPLIYGVNFPPSEGYIQDSGATFIRWGGNASSSYNWKNFFADSAADWYFQDNVFAALGLNTSSTGANSVTFVQDVVQAGADPLMTLPMLGWVAKGGPEDYSFSVQKYGYKPCATNPYVADDGEGIQFATGCPGSTPEFVPANPVYVTNNDTNDANVPLLDQPGSNDPAGSVYRNQWVAVLTPAFGAAPHFYDMDNEPMLWSSTHRDVHPQPVTYDELLQDFTAEAGNLKSWDPQALTFGPVSCCREFYWNSAAGSTDKQANGNEDFWPWWLNNVVWEGDVEGQSLLNVFDFHAYPEINAPPAGATAAQVDALALPSTRGWWDTTYTSPGWIGSNVATSMQPLPHVEARLVRAEAMVNEIAPGLPLSITEWNFSQSGEDPIAVALTDAEAFGLLGQYDFYAAARWEAPDPTQAAPSYQVLKLYRNYDGQHDGFAPISIAATNDCGANAANPFDCSTFAAINSGATELTLMVVNKSPDDVLAAALNLQNFTPAQVATYAVTAANPHQIVATPPVAFNANMTFPPYSATLLVLTGQGTPATTEWSLLPTLPPVATPWTPPPVMMVSAGGVATFQLTPAAGGTVKITAATADTPLSAQVVTLASGATEIEISAPANALPGFYHFQVTGTDGGGVTTTQDGMVEVGLPAATLTATGDQQSAPAGSAVTLSVTANPGSSGAAPGGLDVLFNIVSGGGSLAPFSGVEPVALSANGAMILVPTNASGTASVTLTLPATAGAVHVQAEAPYPIGHPLYVFQETAQ